MALDQLIQEQLTRILASEVAIKELQRANRPVKSNLVITNLVAPTVDNDITEGYSNGSIWINDSNGDIFMNVDNTIGLAVWVLVGSGSQGSVFDFVFIHEDALVTTTSATYSQIGGFTGTPAEKGTFDVWVSLAARGTNASTRAGFAIFSGTTLITERDDISFVAAMRILPIAVNTQITQVTPAAITAQFRKTAGPGTLEVTDRDFKITEVA